MYNNKLIIIISLILIILIFRLRIINYLFTKKIENFSKGDQRKQYLKCCEKNGCAHHSCRYLLYKKLSYNPMERIGYIKSVDTDNTHYLYQHKNPHNYRSRTYYYLAGKRWNKHFVEIKNVSWLSNGDTVSLDKKDYQIIMWDISSPNRYHVGWWYNKKLNHYPHFIRPNIYNI